MFTAAHQSWHGALTCLGRLFCVMLSSFEAPGFLISLETTSCTPSGLLWGSATVPVWRRWMRPLGVGGRVPLTPAGLGGAALAPHTLAESALNFHWEALRNQST